MAKKTVTHQMANSEEALLDRYFDEISQGEQLTEVQERELSRRVLQGDEKAADRLVSANLRFVVSIARGYVTDGVSILDLIGEGNIGLIKAAHKYDATKGQRFCQYAVWDIRKAIEAALPKEQPRMNRTATEHIAGSEKAADNSVAEITATEEMAQAIKLLPEREQQVLDAYYGIDCEQLNMAEIADKLGLKRERVRQIRDRALRRLHSFRNKSFDNIR